jgi:lipoprotein-anchoring transpeptidase ErfK/SrfK
MKMNPAPRSLDDDIRRRLPQAGKRPEMAAPAPVPARSEAKVATRRGLLVPILLGALVCLVLGFITVSASAPVVASALFAQATATPPAQFARVDIAKPSATPPPTITPSPTVTPSPLPTETPGMMEVSIVVDTPVPERGSVQSVDAAPAYAGNKYILVDISEQHMYVYEGDALLWSFVASTGMNNATRAGNFHVQSKIPNAYGATWNIWMPNWLGIYYSGGLENGIHALPILPSGARLWAGFLGRPISYGCVVLGVYESEQLYNWAEIGTPVEIRW